MERHGALQLPSVYLLLQMQARAPGALAKCSHSDGQLGELPEGTRLTEFILAKCPLLALSGHSAP